MKIKTRKIQITLVTFFISKLLLGCADSKLETLNPPANDSTNVEEPAPNPNPQEPVTPPSTPEPGSGFNLKEEIKHYSLRYELESLTEKMTDNKGAGAEEFYGTRNFRVVLPGVFYRGGANNKYFDPPRSNTNPLPEKGLENLCEENFSTAVYLYAENFSVAPKSMTCKNISQQKNVLQYKQYAAAGENEKILDLVYKRIKGKLTGPIYAHCWNGWHSSGLISGMVLKQFCNFTNEQADKYWVANTDGNFEGFERIRARLRDFKPIAKFAITEEERAIVCPKPL